MQLARAGRTRAHVVADLLSIGKAIQLPRARVEGHVWEEGHGEPGEHGLPPAAAHLARSLPLSLPLPQPVASTPWPGAHVLASAPPPEKNPIVDTKQIYSLGQGAHVFAPPFVLPPARMLLAPTERSMLARGVDECVDLALGGVTLALHLNVEQQELHEPNGEAAVSEGVINELMIAAQVESKRFRVVNLGVVNLCADPAHILKSPQKSVQAPIYIMEESNERNY